MKLIMSKTVFDVNSNKQIPIVINNINLGTFSWGIYSKWYLQRVDCGRRAIPNINKYISGLLLKKYGIDIRNYDEKSLSYISKKIKYNTVGEWFENYMEQDYAENRYSK